jgi:hypothetical protein
VTRLALKEWAVAVDAIARGDMLVTLRKGGIREKEFLVEGERFWLLPTYEHQNAAQTKPLWHRELGASAAARPGGGQLALRCQCVVHAAHPLEDVAAVAALEPFHLWTQAYAEERLGWRPRKPLWALVLRGYALPEPVRLPHLDAYDGCRSWTELAEEPSDDDLLPALTDEAFALHAERVAAALSGVPTAS